MRDVALKLAQRFVELAVDGRHQRTAVQQMRQWLEDTAFAIYQGGVAASWIGTVSGGGTDDA